MIAPGGERAPAGHTLPRAAVGPHFHHRFRIQRLRPEQQLRQRRPLTVGCHRRAEGRRERARAVREKVQISARPRVTGRGPSQQRRENNPETVKGREDGQDFHGEQGDRSCELSQCRPKLHGVFHKSRKPDAVLGRRPL